MRSRALFLIHNFQIHICGQLHYHIMVHEWMEIVFLVGGVPSLSEAADFGWPSKNSDASQLPHFEPNSVLCYIHLFI